MSKAIDDDINFHFFTDNDKALDVLFPLLASGDKESYFKAVADLARTDQTEAQEMLNGFNEAIERGKPIPKAILMYLHAAFHDYLWQGKPIEKALFLTQPAHGPKNKNIIPKCNAVGAFYWVTKKFGVKKEDAYRVVAAVFHKSDRMIQNYVRQFREERGHFYSFSSSAPVEHLEVLVESIGKRAALEREVKKMR